MHQDHQIIIEKVKQELIKYSKFTMKDEYYNEIYIDTDIFELQVKVMINELQWSVDEIVKHELKNAGLY